jgi:hypothetical protein
VALSSDASTALIGGPLDSGTAGAAWVFTRSGSTWTQQQRLTAAAGTETGTGAFGWNVALSSDGRTALIGGPYDSGHVGAAWVFTRSGASWTQQQPLAAAPGTETGAGGFGTSVALSSDARTALIAGPYDNGDVGAAWVFTNPVSIYTLGVSLAGTGSGRVVSSPAGVSCPGSCSHAFPNGTSVSLTATPAPGSAFAGWSGACTGTGICAASMSTDRTVTATFTLLPRAKITKVKINRKHHQAKFTFKATGARGFQCALVRQPGKKASKPGQPRFAQCKSPKSYTKLKRGKYIFEVRAFSALGAGPVAKRRFTI